jgi:shikimate dehydrogenase
MTIDIPIVGDRDNYCVFGNPISHSKSPLIHAAFARQCHQAIAYTAVLVPEGQFADYLERFRELGGRGANVTLPFKTDAWRLCNSRTPRAERSGAVNTLWFDDAGRVCGDNTDGAGLVADIRNLGWAIRGRSVLLLGAGGAGRGVIPSLLDQRPARLFIANRTAERAEALASSFSADGDVAGGGFASISGQFDLVINATSASLKGEVPDLPVSTLAAGAACYDMMYGRAPTPFLRWASGNGIDRLADGLGMLVEQAAEAFEIWRGIRPDTPPVLAMLRARLEVSAEI